MINKKPSVYSPQAAWCCNKCCGVSVSDLSELVVLLCEKLQELDVACCPRELQRCDSLLIWKTDGHQTAGLAKQQLRQPMHSPSHSQVKGRLPETVLWRGGQTLQETLKTKMPAYVGDSSETTSVIRLKKKKKPPAKCDKKKGGKHVRNLVSITTSPR